MMAHASPLVSMCCSNLERVGFMHSCIVYMVNFTSVRATEPFVLYNCIILYIQVVQLIKVSLRRDGRGFGFGFFSIQQRRAEEAKNKTVF